MTQTISQVQTTYNGKTYTGVDAVAAEVLNLGGSPAQALAAASLVSGIETSPSDPIDIANYGSNGAEGLFQFEPETWIGNGGGAYSSTAGEASWQQQVAVFVNATAGGNYGDWRPDFVPGLDPNSSSSYGPSVSAPQAGSNVANVASTLMANDGTLSGLIGNLPNWADAGGVSNANPIPGPVGDVVGLATNQGGFFTDVESAPGKLFSGIDAVGNFFNKLVSGFGIGWKAILTIIGGALLILIGLLIMFRHQAEQVAPAAAMAAA